MFNWYLGYQEAYQGDLLTKERRDPLDLSCLHQIRSLQNGCGTMNGRHLARLHAYNPCPSKFRRACANYRLSFLFCCELEWNKVRLVVSKLIQQCFGYRDAPLSNHSCNAWLLDNITLLSWQLLPVWSFPLWPVWLTRYFCPQSSQRVLHNQRIHVLSCALTQL